MEYNFMIKKLKKKLKKKARHFNYSFEKSNLGFNNAYNYCSELFDNILKEFSAEQLEKYDLTHKLEVGFISEADGEVITVSY